MRENKKDSEAKRESLCFNAKSLVSKSLALLENWILSRLLCPCHDGFQPSLKSTS